MITIPLVGRIHQNYADMAEYLKNKIVQDISGELADVIHPCTNILEKWFQQNLPLRDVRAIFFVRNLFTPRELHIRKVSKYLTGRENQMTEESLVEQGILILPFEYFEITATFSTVEHSVDEVVFLNRYINAYIISAIGCLNPRERSPIIILEDDYSKDYTLEEIISTYDVFSLAPQVIDRLDFGIYIDAEIPHTEMPIKLSTFYYIDAYKKREPKIINQFISQICHKL